MEKMKIMITKVQNNEDIPVRVSFVNLDGKKVSHELPPKMAAFVQHKYRTKVRVYKI